MIIKSIDLENYCQHRSRHIDVQGNLIAVVGPNGRGKSNLLGAIQFALTGEQPGKDKGDLLSWGAKDGHVTLTFEHDGKPGTVTRYIKSNKATLVYDGVETSGITAVANEMSERLHMDKDLVRQSVFVRQKEIDAIISAKTDKQAREVAFQKLIGIDAAKIHRNLTDWMYTATKPANYDLQLTDAQRQLGVLETRIVGLEGEVRDAQAKLDAAGKPDDSGFVLTRKAIAAVTAVLAAHDYVHTCKMADSKAASDLQAAQHAVADIGVNPGINLATKAQENQVLNEEIAKGNALICATAARDTAQNRVAAQENAVAALTAQRHPTDTELKVLEDELQATQASVAAKTAEIAAHRKALGALNGGETACPVCGKPLDGDTVARLTAELGVLEQEASGLVTALESRRGQLASCKTAKSAWEMENARATAALEAAKKALETAEADLAKLVRPTLDVPTAQKALLANQEAIAAQKAFDEKAAGRKAALQDAEIRAKAATDSVTAAEAGLAAAETTAKAALGIPATEEVAARDWNADKTNLEGLVAAADKKRQEVQALEVALTRVMATRDEAVKSKVGLEATVKLLKEKQAAEDVLAQRLATLEKVRDWFHYANGPRVIVQQVLAALTDDVNRFLGNFTAPFVVIPDSEQLGFKVEFTDGRVKPEEAPGTDVLSGGECVQLAVAFRLAIYAMFAGKLGLLSLDEPTAYLDDGNVDRFGVLLGKVRDLARNMNTQVFMATHERAVIPHMDSVIDLND